MLVLLLVGPESSHWLALRANSEVSVSTVHPDSSFELEDVLTPTADYSAVVVNLDSVRDVHEGCAVFRRSGGKLPILGLTTHPGDPWSDMRAHFLECGGDDLLPAACSSRELIASIKACVGRAKPREITPVLSFQNAFGDVLVMNRECRSVSVNDRLVRLTGGELRLLSVIADNGNRPVTQDFLMSVLYTDVRQPDTNIVAVNISRIRWKLKAVSPTADFIQTNRGIGYTIAGRILSDEDLLLWKSRR